MSWRRRRTVDLLAERDHTGPRRLPRERSAAVTELFGAHYGHLVRTARLLVDDTETAEDVVMEAFTSLYRRWTAIRDPDDAYRYLRSSVLNGARSQLRRRRVIRLHQVDALSPEPEDAPTQSDVAVVGTNRATVVGLLRALPVRQRQVLVMRYFLDMSEREIADDLAISPGSVKTHASRGMAALARALEGTR
jgi:RNA polymerase sigma-70 factor (sigma-E family)